MGDGQFHGNQYTGSLGGASRPTDMTTGRGSRGGQTPSEVRYGLGRSFKLPRQSENLELVEVDPRKLDAAWEKDNRVSPSGENEIGNRREQFIDWLKSNPGEQIEAPTVHPHWDNKQVVFSDGRHRFAVLRDSGQKTVKIAVPKTDVKYFRRFR